MDSTQPAPARARSQTGTYKAATRGIYLATRAEEAPACARSQTGSDLRRLIALNDVTRKGACIHCLKRRSGNRRRSPSNRPSRRVPSFSMIRNAPGMLEPTRRATACLLTWGLTWTAGQGQHTYVSERTVACVGYLLAERNGAVGGVSQPCPETVCSAPRKQTVTAKTSEKD